MKSDNPVILVVKYRALGDSVMGLSTISYLRTIYPDSKIYYGIRAWTAALYEKISTDANSIVEIRLDSFVDYIKLFKSIKNLKVTHVHELHLSGRTFKFFSITKHLLNFTYTYHDHHSKKGKVLDQGHIKSLIQRDLDGVYSHLSNGVIPNYLQYPPRFKLKEAIRVHRIIFGVVATRETKMWPLQYFVELARMIKSKHEGIEICVPLSNSVEDLEIKLKLESLDSAKVLKIVSIELKNLPEYFTSSLLYIGNDTGLKHIAVASGIKSYTLFGPEPPNEWHPYNKEEHPYFYIDKLECRTIKAHYCALTKCESMICLNQISPKDVYEKVKEDLV